MSKSEEIRLLYRERCSIYEIAAAVGYREEIVMLFVDRMMNKERPKVSGMFNGWRGYPISDKVVSL